MKKTVKKLDNNVVKGLTAVCETFKAKQAGFEWITHTADYSNFPASLVITCVFDTNEALRKAKESKLDIDIRIQVQQQLLKMGVLLKDAKRHVCFDTEEACFIENNGDWSGRL
jgi:hypothetical protein